MPRILLNTTTLYIGGALQTSVNFIAQIVRNPAEFTWHFVLSKRFADEAKKAGIVLPNDAKVFSESPAKNRSIRKEIKAYADQLKPDAVFSFGGPAYVKFAQPHLLGCTAPWVTHAGIDAYRTLDFPLEWIYFWLDTQYKKHWFKAADMWVMQTENSRQGLHKRLGIPLEKIHVVSNSCGAPYFEQIESVRPFPEAKKKVRLFCFTSFYKHKNLIVLPIIAAELKKLNPAFQFEIVLTLADDDNWKKLQSLAQKLNVSDSLVNHGPIPVSQGPSLYQTCDLLLLPTVLETFSATYPEAMAMGLPIVTSDLDFARDVCGDAALYFPPRDARVAAETILKLVADRELWNTLIARGKERLKQFPSPSERSEMYLKIIRKLLAK